MPQLTLDFSSNILPEDKQNLPDLLVQINLILTENLPTSLDSCKSRAVERNIFAVGHNLKERAFVHLALRIMQGRSLETIQITANKIIDLLSEYFAASGKILDLQITIDVEEIREPYYFKRNI